MSNFFISFCTTPDTGTSERLAGLLVESGLAACVNIIPGMTSVYEWQGKIEKEQECLLIIKSTEEKYKQIEDMIIENHPYDLPEVISVKIEKGYDQYLKWIEQTVKE